MGAKLAVGLLVLLGGFRFAPPNPPVIGAGAAGIKGQVVDAQTGNPVAKAMVMAEPDVGQSAGKLVSVLSDEKGNFLLNDLAPGWYVIPAAKEDEDYPNADNAAFAGQLTISPRVLVRDGEITGGVVVRIEKGAKLVGTIIDSRTHQAVVTARIRLTRADHPEWWLFSGPDLNGRFKFVIPARPFQLEVSAPGYRIWHYSGGGGYTLLLKQQSQENITVVLERD